MSKGYPTTTVWSFIKKMQLRGYLKIYRELNVSISTRYCCTITGIKKPKKPSGTHLNVMITKRQRKTTIYKLKYL